MKKIIPLLSLFLISGCSQSGAEYLRESINVQTELVDWFCNMRDEQTADLARTYFERSYSERTQLMTDRYNKMVMLLGSASLGRSGDIDLNQAAEILNKGISIEAVIANPGMGPGVDPPVVKALGKKIHDKEMASLVEAYPNFYKQYLANCRRITREIPRLQALAQELKRKAGPDCCPSLDLMIQGIGSSHRGQNGILGGALQPAPAFVVWKAYQKMGN